MLKQLKEQNDHVLVDLLKVFMVLLFIPQLIQQILDFKSWVLGYLKIDLDDPKDIGLAIQLWKSNNRGLIKLPSGIPITNNQVGF